MVYLPTPYEFCTDGTYHVAKRMVYWSNNEVVYVPCLFIKSIVTIVQ